MRPLRGLEAESRGVTPFKRFLLARVGVAGALRAVSYRARAAEARAVSQRRPSVLTEAYSMTITELVEGRVRTLLAAWDTRDLDAFVGLLAPDVYWHDLGMPHPPAIGREAVRRFSESVLRAFPDFTLTLRSPLCVAADGLSCVVPWTITATNTGVLDPPGVAPTGQRVRFDGLDYIQFRDGLVTRIETRFDPVEPLEQLLHIRLRPRPGSLRERIFVLLQRPRAAWLRRTAGRGAAVG